LLGISDNQQEKVKVNRQDKKMAPVETGAVTKTNCL